MMDDLKELCWDYSTSVRQHERILNKISKPKWYQGLNTCNRLNGLDRLNTLTRLNC